MKKILRIIKKSQKIRGFIVCILNVLIKKYMKLCTFIFGIDNNTVVFSSFVGKSYSDNPRAISEKLYEINKNVNIVWLFNNVKEKKKLVPDYVKCIKNNSFSAFKVLATSKVWVDNFCKPLFLNKTKDQSYIQTFHGDRGFKKVMHDSNFAPKNYKVFETKNCDLMNSGSNYGSKMLKSGFKYSKEILEFGTPRNDIFFEKNYELKSMIRKKIGIASRTKVLLYAPTLRRDSVSNGNAQNIIGLDLEKVLVELENKTEHEWSCLFRAHSSVSKLNGILESDKIIDASNYEDMKDLLFISDMLITDYSSCAGDFALTKNGIILFQENIEKYLKEDREMYFDINKSPYYIAKNQNEIIGYIKNKNEKDYVENCNEILKFYGTFESGNAAEKTVEFINKKVMECEL